MGTASGIGAGLVLVFAWQFGVGYGAGFGAGMAFETSPPPRRTRLELRGRWGVVAKLAVCYSLAGTVAAFPTPALLSMNQGYVAQLISSPTRHELDPIHDLAVGATAGAAGFIIALASVAVGRKRRASPTGDVAASSGTRTMLIEMFVSGFGTGLLAGLALGFVGGVSLAITFGCTLAAVVAVETPIDAQTRNGPLELLRTDRANAMLFLVVFAAATGIPIGLALGLALGPLWGVTLGVGGGFAISAALALFYSAWGRWLLLARLWLPLTGRMPWAMTAFLRDAHRIGVLRQAGGVFQFRHARLQERLGDDDDQYQGAKRDEHDRSRVGPLRVDC